MDKSKALALLPHGIEFRFVTEALELDPGAEGLGSYFITGREPFLKGHFPGEPIFPGVLLIEAGAQMAGIVAQSDPKIPPMPGLKLTAIRAAKILGAAKPGQELRIHARLTGRLDNLVQADIMIECENKILAQGSLTLSGERPQNQLA